MRAHLKKLGPTFSAFIPLSLSFFFPLFPPFSSSLSLLHLSLIVFYIFLSRSFRICIQTIRKGTYLPTYCHIHLGRAVPCWYVVTRVYFMISSSLPTSRSSGYSRLGRTTVSTQEMSFCVFNTPRNFDASNVKHHSICLLIGLIQ